MTSASSVVTRCGFERFSSFRPTLGWHWHWPMTEALRGIDHSIGAPEAVVAESRRPARTLV